jgi:hypothetical protein
LLIADSQGIYNGPSQLNIYQSNGIERISNGGKKTQELRQWAVGGIEDESMVGSEKPGER